MLLKNPISNTKRFFHRTLQTVKSIFSPTTIGNYHKIPKSPPPPSMNHIAVAAAVATAASSESGRVYVDFNNHRWEKSGKRPRDHDRNINNAKCSTREVEEEKEWSREKKSWWVARKLKELEMMDTSDVDHVLDIEEVLHYYSRLSCPEYLDIVDKFFIDVYSEFFSSSSPPVLHSTSKLHPARC